MLVVLFLETGQSKPMYKLTFLWHSVIKHWISLFIKTGKFHWSNMTRKKLSSFYMSLSTQKGSEWASNNITGEQNFRKFLQVYHLV